MKIIVRIAPISSSNPAVPNNPIPVLAPMRPNDLLRKKAVMTNTKNSTTSAKRSIPSELSRALKFCICDNKEGNDDHS